MSILLDTNVLIDYSRNNPVAVSFVESLPRQPEISVVTLAELLAGAKNRKEETQIGSLGRWLKLRDVNAEIAMRAGEFLKHFRNSHGTDDFDALIAATAENHGLKLATLNIKHFPMFPKLKPPY